MKEPEPLKYTAFQDREAPADWRVEALDELTNGCYIAVFGGLDAEYRANEYAAFKNGKHPVFKPAIPDLAPPVKQVDEKITIKVQDGQEVSFVPSTLDWSWNNTKKSITGKQKPLIDFILGKGKS